MFFADEALPIKEPADIFTLKFRDQNNLTKLRDRHGFGEKSASNLFDAIEKKKSIEFSRFIFSLGIRHIGENVSKLLARHFISWSKFISSISCAQNRESQEYFDLLAIDGIGTTVVNSLLSTFEVGKERDSIENLVSHLDILYEILPDSENNFLSGNFICHAL